MNDFAHKYFDPKINIALLLTIFLQTIGAFFWVGSQSQRLNGVETRINAQGAVNERLARLEEQVIQARQSLDRIENRLDDTRRNNNQNNYGERHE